MTDRPDLAMLLADPTTVPLDEIPATIGELEKIKAMLWARLASAPNGSTGPDDVLDVVEAAGRLSMTVSHLRHQGDRLHAEFLAATGEGFIIPWSEGTVRYSASGLEALKRWRRSQPRRRSLASDTPERL